MAEMSNKAGPSLSPDSVESVLQSGMTNWVRAVTHITNCAFAASVAQMEMLRALSPAAPEAWSDQLTTVPAQTDRHAALRVTRIRFDEAIERCRRINDDFARGMFTAADMLLEGVPKPGTDKPRS